MKAKLRAWLIELVRDAIRMECVSIQPVGTAPKPSVTVRAVEATAKQLGPIEPSFEQMQADAIQAQEKYYAPESK